ncbi:MAG: FAD:protein FMN transferase [Clostridia bacterium]|nr:FAD:protein FMN transferase [Clostridia bacterium]
MHYRRHCKTAAVALAALCLLTGCAKKEAAPQATATAVQPAATVAPELSKYSLTYLELFDTVTTVTGYAESREAFRAKADGVRDILAQYHKLFDIYNDYEGVKGVKAVNDAAGKEPVAVEPEVIELIEFARAFAEESHGKCDISMGPVLLLWHNAREAGIADPEHAALPAEDALKEALTHTGFDKVVVDKEAGTVFLTDPQARLDVGAIAKGWAAEQVRRNAAEGLLISVGGNVVVTGPKADGSKWRIGVQNPDDLSGYVSSVGLTHGSVVTSGDYQRYYTVDGVNYHHILDPDTLYPGTKYRGVTVFTEDSAVADALSTSVFLLGEEEGRALLKAHDAEGLWILPDGTMHMTEGYKTLSEG